MGRRALAVSLAVHVALLALVARLSAPASALRTEASPLTIDLVVPEPEPEPEPVLPEAPAAARAELATQGAAVRSTRLAPLTSEPQRPPLPVPPPAPESKSLTMRAPAPGQAVLDPNLVARLVAPKEAPPPSTPTKLLPTPAPDAALRRQPLLSDLFTSGPYKRDDDKDKWRFFSDYTPEDLNRGYAASGFFVDDDVTPTPLQLDRKGDPRGKPKGGGSFHIDRPQFKADVAADGTVAFHDVPALNAKVLPCLHSRKELRRCADNLEFPLIRGHFDLNDWAERMAGNDPYLYEKKKYLEATREERMKMARAALRERLRDAVRAAPPLLRELWRDPSVSPKERRHMVFQLWDECAEEGDDDILVASRAFRGTVLAFIRRQLPAGSADAYPAAELDALNRSRLSAQPFDPYGGDDR